jgi:hypothetical protein
MKYLSFNPLASLKKEKPVFDDPLVVKGIDVFYNFILVFTPIFLASIFLYLQWQIRSPLFFPLSILFCPISLFISYFVFLQIRKARYFRKFITNNKRRENIDLVNSLCHMRKWRILSTTNESHIIKIESYKLFQSFIGRELFILYEDNYVYIRCLTYGIYDTINPFHWKKQRQIEESVAQFIIS